MASISSPGLASGLDIKSIVSQLTALERAPVQTLQKEAASMNSKLSIFGTMKSSLSGLSDAAKKLSDPALWTGMKATSGDPLVATVTAGADAVPGKLSVRVETLARAQSYFSGPLNVATGLGGGSLSFTDSVGVTKTITIDEAADSPQEIAKKINADSSLGVTATVLKDATGTRLLFTSAKTGLEGAFTVTATGGNADGLQQLNSAGMEMVQDAANAIYVINGAQLESASNTLKDVVPGITINLLRDGSQVDLTIASDTDSMKKAVQSFVDAYNSLNSLITTTTKYDETTKTAATLQGDATARGLQNALRNMMSSITPGGQFTRLADIGIVAKQGGDLEIKSSKLDAAIAGNIADVQKLFADDKGTPTEDGFGLKVKRFAESLADGLIANRQKTLQASIDRNAKEQDRVNLRADRAQARFLAQYNAMDAAVGKLNSLGAYVNQQVTLWNSVGN